MPIDAKPVFHGAVLSPIVDHPEFKSLNKVRESDGTYRYGHYSVTTSSGRVVQVFVKYLSKGRTSFRFEMSSEERGRIWGAARYDGDVYLALVCGREEVCLLPRQHLRTILKERREGAVVRVRIEPGRWLRVEHTRPGGERWRKLSTSISRSSFPKEIFD